MKSGSDSYFAPGMSQGQPPSAPCRLLRPELVPGLLAALLLMGDARAQQVENWAVHSMDRPQPRIVDPGPAGPPSPPPTDAIVLFDGRNLQHWRAENGGDARWKVENGYMEVVAGTGGLVTAASFGDVQLHVEFASPATVRGEGQERGNSGVFLMGRYEVQVLDSYNNATYPDGQAGALYGQFPPLVNASRPPGQWQSYDIVFRAPRFDAQGRLLQPARMTVFHNQVLIHDNVALTGPTAHRARPPYQAHAAQLPISLQDHGDAVRFRNIWVRRLD